MKTTSLTDFTYSTQPVEEKITYALDIGGCPDRLLMPKNDRWWIIDLDTWNAYDTNELSIPMILQTDFHIEPDISTAFDASTVRSKIGNIALRDGRLYLNVKINDGGYKRPETIDLISGLPPIGPNLALGFTSWALVQKVGDEKKILRQFETGQATGPEQ